MVSHLISLYLGGGTIILIQIEAAWVGHLISRGSNASISLDRNCHTRIGNSRIHRACTH